MRLFSILLLSSSLMTPARPQEQLTADTSEFADDIQMEKILEAALQDDENSIAAEDLIQLEDDPLNLNTASAEELHRIPGISNCIASRIIERRKRKRFTSVEELAGIEGITPDLIPFLRHYVTMKWMKEQSNISAVFLSRTSTEIEERQGYITGAYPGSPFKVLNRLRISIGNNTAPFSSMVSKLEVGLLTKKDPGEQHIANSSTYFVGVSVPSIAARFIIGDYQMEAAEGLIFWRASSFGKGSDVIAPARKNGSGIRPSLSSDENSYLHGISALIGLDRVQVQFYYSNKKFHATIDSLGTISALYNSGLFRTENEQRKRNASRELLFGCRTVTYCLDGLKIGGTVYRTRFANPLLLSGKIGERASDFWMKGMDMSWTGRTLDIFSECAFDRANAGAVIVGLTYEPTAALAVTVSARRYPPAFQSVHGNAFGESSGRVQNENGLYVGIRTQLRPGLRLSTYYDQFEHSLPTAHIPAPSHGNDFLALAEYSLTDQYEIAFRYKRKDMPSVAGEYDVWGRIIQRIHSRIHQQYRLTSEFTSSPSLRLSSRVEWVNIQYHGRQTMEKGVLISQSMKCRVFHALTIQARIVFFETDSYDSAIYEFEDEVPGAFANPALFGRGMRWYFILRSQVLSKINMAVKYGQTVKEGIKSIGTGLDVISGDSQSVVSMQVEVRL